VPQAAHGQVVHAADAKKSVHVPCAHTWFVAQGMPHTPGWFEQKSGLLASCCAV
jgi:hypothetical protein